MVLKGHTGSVLCLQYSEQVIVTGSVDSTIRSVCQQELSLVYVTPCGYMYAYMRTGTVYVRMYMNSAHMRTKLYIRTCKPMYVHTYEYMYMNNGLRVFNCVLF